MTLDKNGIRCMIEEFFTDYGPHHRFELDLSNNVLTVTAQKAKVRIPHGKQKRLGGF